MPLTFIDRVNTLLEKTPPASGTEWEALSRDLRPEHFEFVLTLLDRQQPLTVNALQLAYQRFATRNTSFCTFLSRAVIRREDARFLAGAPTFANRITLRSLADAAFGRTEADPDLLIALAFHRAYKETIAGVSTVGRDVRLRLRDQIKRILQPTAAVPKPAFRFVPVFRFIFRNTDKLTVAFDPEWDDKSFLLEALKHLTDAHTRAELDFRPEGSFDQQPLYALTDVLAFVLNDLYPYGDTVRASVNAALLQTVEHAVHLWSLAYTPLDHASVDSLVCLRSEAYLHGIVERLQTRNKQPGYFGPEAAEQYRGWIELCGGYDRTVCESFLKQSLAQPPASPAPFYQRDWLRAEEQGRKSTLLFSIAPFQLVRHFDLLRRPGSSEREEPPRLTETEYASKMSQEIWAVAIAQGLVPSFDIVKGDIPEGAPLETSGLSALLPKATIERKNIGDGLHPDHRRALRIMAAVALQWRADIAYRTAGPRIIVSGFTPEQVREIKRAQSLYELALNLIGGENDAPLDRFIIGMGLMGVALDEKRRELRDECVMRLQQIRLRYDWSAASVEWPLTYVDTLQSQVDNMLRIVDIAGSLGAIAARKADLTLAIEERALAVVQAQHEKKASEAIVEAESYTFEALEIETATADIRLKIATFRETEAKYQAAAHRYAAASAGQKAEAKEALETIEIETELQLEGQLTILRDQIHKLLGGEGDECALPKLRREIDKARDSLTTFEKDARDRHREKQSRGALISIVKKVGALVSMYYTGVDLVAIAETSIQAVKSAQSGDWAGAIMCAKEAGDLATGGAFSDALNRGVITAERYIGTVMADSLGDAAKVLEMQMGIKGPAAIQAGVEAVSRQAFRLGVSYLAKETGTREIFAALGIPNPLPASIVDLRLAAETQLLDAAWQAFKKRGDEAMKGIATVLQIDPSQVEEKLKQNVRTAQEAGRSAEEVVVKLIARVETSNPKATGILAELKNGLLEERDQLTARLSKAVQREKADVAHALDKVIAKALTEADPHNLPLPPIAMPAEVVTAVTDFRRKTEVARAKIGFLTTPGKAEELANQLSNAEDDKQFNENLDRIVADLRTNCDDADQAMNDAEQDLALLQAKLTATDVELYKQRFRKQAADLEAQAANSDAQAAAQMGLAAAEAVLGAEQQIRIEEFGIKIAEKRRASQQTLIEAKKSLLEAAVIEIQIREIALRRAERTEQEWLRDGQLNPDQQRIAQSVKTWCLTKANTLLAQWWQLLNVYEVSERLQQLPNAPTPPFAPTFLIPDKAKIIVGQTLLTLARSQWNSGLLEGPRLLTTIQFSRIRDGLNDDEKKKLNSYFTEIGNQIYPSLKLRGRSDLTRLLGGVTFQVRRAGSENPDAPFDYVRNLPLSAFTDTISASGRIRQQTGTTFLESNAFAAWDDKGSTRIRLLGVLLEILNNGAIRQGNMVKILMRQEQGPGIFVRDPKIPLKRLWIPIPLAAMESEDDLDRGVLLEHGEFQTTQWQTRPLFGTYSVRTANELSDFLHPENFSAAIHFVALGRP